MRKVKDMSLTDALFTLSDVNWKKWIEGRVSPAGNIVAIKTDGNVEILPAGEMTEDRELSVLFWQYSSGGNNPEVYDIEDEKGTVMQAFYDVRNVRGMEV